MTHRVLPQPEANMPTRGQATGRADCSYGPDGCILMYGPVVLPCAGGSPLDCTSPQPGLDVIAFTPPTEILILTTRLAAVARRRCRCIHLQTWTAAPHRKITRARGLPPSEERRGQGAARPGEQFSQGCRMARAWLVVSTPGAPPNVTEIGQALRQMGINSWVP